MRILKGHKSQVRALAVSPDGQTLASVAGQSRTIWLWNLAEGKRRLRLSGQGSLVLYLAFSPQGDLLASLERWRRIRLWDPNSGQEQREIWSQQFHPGTELTFAPDGRTLAVPATVYHSGRHQWGAQILRVDTGQEVCQLLGHESWVRAVAYSADGRTLATGGSDHTVQLWDLTTRQSRATLAQQAEVAHLAFAPDGRTLAVVVGWSVVLWDLQKLQPRHLLRGHTGLLWALAFNPTGEVLATAGNDGTVRFWDVATGRLRSSFDWKIGKVRTVAFAPDGMRAVAGGKGDIVVWDVEDF